MSSRTGHSIPLLRRAGEYWKGAETIEAVDYKCAYCGNQVASDQGFESDCDTWDEEGESQPFTDVTRIYFCPRCKYPTVCTSSSEMIPSPAFGESISDVPSDLNDLYEEARRCTSCGAFTAAVLLCRKMLMNVAVEEGAKPGLDFKSYVDFLEQRNFIPPKGRGWADKLRTTGNQATHKIASKTQQDAEDMVTFVQLLLLFNYSLPAKHKP